MQVTPELLAHHDRPGPRYTSYPTAVEFAEDFGPAQYAARLDMASQLTITPLSLYVHLPFCESRCSFCGCHVVVTKNTSLADVYLDRLVKEAEMVSRRLGERTTLHQYHWGGGTPTYYSPDDLARLHTTLMGMFDMAPGAEVAIEVDPRVTTVEHLEVLRGLGFNRLSMGIQDFDPTVQDLIGRHQTVDEAVELHTAARAMGFESINFDLIYGLPGQSDESFAATLEKVTELMPDRLAVYSFAYMPSKVTQQIRIDESKIPDRDTKFRLLTAAVDRLVGAGYVQIGMDHFALPDDDLTIARANGTLSRNFMGYTTKRSPDVVAIGTSGISDVQGAYAQNHKRMTAYYGSVDAGELPIERGIALSPDDLVRRYVITELMCNGNVRADDVENRFGISFTEYFAAELASLASPGGAIEEGLVEATDGDLRATELGELFIRNVAMEFDAYMAAHRDSSKPHFSRTV